MAIYRLLFTVTILLSIYQAVSAIDCYQCDSNIDLECNEKFDSDKTILKPKSCEGVYEARFCIKTTGMYSGRIGTLRNCSSRDQGDYCNYIKRPGDSVLIRSCVYTCSRDGCNSAFFVTATTSLLISLTSSAIALFV